MATKKIKKSELSSTIAGRNPFDAVVEAISEKPKRAVKVIKASKPASSTSTGAQISPRGARQPVNFAADAFAEVARTVVTEEAVSLELPPDTARTQKKAGRVKKATKSPKPSTSGVEAALTAGAEKPRKASRRAATPKADRTTIADRSSAFARPEIDSLQNRTAEIASTGLAVELSPVFKKLAEVKLPQLSRENRARLQMQSPTRLYLYWSLKQDPWQQLRSVFGPDFGSYTLVVKLRDLTAEREHLHRIETQGEWWFNEAEPDSEYMAEIGFYATNRPYFRLLYSNTITTPREAPSPHPATEARWTVSATKFAEVLDASGFTRDAIDVAIAGDDHLDAEQRTRLAFADLMTGAEFSTKGVAAQDIRHAILALAGGATLEKLRYRVSTSLFNILQANADRLSASGARKSLSEHFDVEETEWTDHEFGPAVFGASLINFPKTLRSRRAPTYSPRYNPVSSFSLGR